MFQACRNHSVSQSSETKKGQKETLILAVHYVDILTA